MSEESILILNMLREGKITAEQADALLRAVRQNAPTPPTPPVPPAAEAPPAARPDAPDKAMRRKEILEAISAGAMDAETGLRALQNL